MFTCNTPTRAGAIKYALYTIRMRRRTLSPAVGNLMRQGHDDDDADDADGARVSRSPHLLVALCMVYIELNVLSAQTQLQI